MTDVETQKLTNAEKGEWYAALLGELDEIRAKAAEPLRKVRELQAQLMVMEDEFNAKARELRSLFAGGDIGFDSRMEMWR